MEALSRTLSAGIPSPIPNGQVIPDLFVDHHVNGLESHKLFAVEGGKAVGFVGLYALTGEADIVRVGVLPQYRNCGIARAVLQKSLEDVQGDVFLDVRESNAAAIALYRSLGFYDTGVRKNYYSDPEENAVLMKRDAVEGGGAVADSGN